MLADRGHKTVLDQHVPDGVDPLQRSISRPAADQRLHAAHRHSVDQHIQHRHAHEHAVVDLRHVARARIVEDVVG